MNLTLIVAAIVGALAFGSAWKIQGWRADAADKARIEAELELASQRAVQADTASASHEKDKATVRVQFQTIYRDVEHVVEKPVYRNVCLDDDGLRLIASAISGPAPAASEPAPAVPASGASR